MKFLIGVFRRGTERLGVRPERGWRGQGLVEFALVLPVIMLLLLITLDFGRLFMSYITLTNETRIAANYGATNPGAFTGTPNTTTYDALVGRETAGLNCALQPDPANPPIPTYPNGTGLSGTSVATMTCKFSFITPFMTDFFGGPLAVTARAEYPIRTGAVANISGTTTLPPPGSPIAAFVFTSVTGGTIDGSGDVSGPGPITVNVTNNSQNAQTWEWDWGDGSPHEFTSIPIAHQFTTSATVKLTVTNTVGSAFTTRHVTVTPVATQPPVAGFYGTPNANPPAYTAGGGSAGVAITGSIRNGVPLVVSFTNQSTNGATDFSWDFGDGSVPSVGVTPSHQYSTLGVFSVTLTVTAPTGGTPFTRNAYVTTGCLVPNFANTQTSNAQAAWDAAGFSGTIYYTSNNPNGGVTNPPSPSQNITSQSPMSGGTFVPATKVGSSWVCAGDIHLRW
jgi:PKD repeat protein